MNVFPYTSPIILNDIVFSQQGGQGTGTFASAILQDSYLTAEIQVTNYLGTPLLPITMTGTYPFMHQQRIVTDFGYVQQILSVGIQTRQNCQDCGLTINEGCGYIYQDTYGYIDFRQLASICGWSWWGYPFAPYVVSYQPYEIQVAYVAGLPSGTANLPPVLRALTILAQVDLNDKFPGLVGQNESVGAVGIQEYKALDYSERRADHALIKTALGDDAMSQRAKKLLDSAIRKARKTLLV
jgi:hypothetical protein